ncbi:unnamed protein product [Blepharisma stoltei]|uniref:Uncharacterized protein n=1 Tax=Blepharisma stoltei TaxID=1481888 RepID=A0AAU9JN17_9CILI|nr:unnamed protein product [Blepharisma stoltei]
MEFGIHPLPLDDIDNQDKVNLRDLILRRLSAAKEQKQRTTQSLSLTPDNNQSSSTFLPQAFQTQSPDIEKQLLLTMLEKTQTLTNQNQVTFAQERKTLENQIESLLSQVHNLQQRNIALSEEMEKYKKYPGSDMSHLQFLEELKSLEKISDEREKKYCEEITSLKRELSEAKLLSTLERSSSYLNSEEKSQTVLSKRLIELENKFEEAKKIIIDKDRELKKFQDNLAWSPQGNIGISIKGNSELKAENEKLERNMKRLISMSCKREAVLTEEIERLRNTSSHLNELTHNREIELQSQIENLTTSMTNLQKNFEQQEGIYHKEKTNWLEERDSLISQLKQLNERYIQADQNSYNRIRKELDGVYETLEEKDRIIDQLRESGLFVIENTQSFENLAEIKNQLSGIHSELEKLNQNTVAVNEAYSKEQTERDEEIYKLHNELTELRHKMSVYEGKKYESEISTLRIDLQKALSEKAHAKRLILAYVRSVQHLEKILSEKQSFSLDDQIATLQLENSRLQEENQSLVEARQKLSETYEAEMKQLQDLIDSQYLKIQDLQAKTEGSSKARLKMISEQTHAWELRQKTLHELNRQLHAHVGLIEAKSLTELQTKEIQDLKNKFETNKKGLIQLRERWEKQREDMRLEIVNLKQKIVALENKDQHTTQELNKHYNTIVNNSKENLKLEETRLIEMKTQNEIFKKTYEEFVRKQKNFYESNDNLIKVMKKECELVGKEIEEIKNMHNDEIKFIRETGPFAEMQQLKQEVKDRERSMKELEDYIRVLEDKHSKEVESFLKLDESDTRKRKWI